jgi:hypothetical protein
MLQIIFRDYSKFHNDGCTFFLFVPLFDTIVFCRPNWLPKINRDSSRDALDFTSTLTVQYSTCFTKKNFDRWIFCLYPLSKT